MVLGNGDVHLISSGFVTKVAVPFWRGPGFAIPLVQSAVGGNTVYVQKVSYSRRITGFTEVIADFDATIMSDPFDLSVGGEEVLAIVDPAGMVRAGFKEDLSEFVKPWLLSVTSPLSRLIFARFCGDRNAAMSAAAALIDQKTSEFRDDTRAVTWFIQSVIFQDIVAAIYHPKDREGIDFAGKSIGVALKRDRIEIAILGEPSDWGRGPKRGDKSLSEVLNLLEAATRKNVSIVASTREAFRETDWVKIRAQRIGEAVNSRSRQEDRLGLIIKDLIVDPSSTLLFLRNYRDKGVHTQRWLDVLREEVAAATDIEEIKSAVARQLPRIVSTAYPLQKGRLLSDLAENIGHFPIFSKILRDAVDRSHAQNVSARRAEILDKLR